MPTLSTRCEFDGLGPPASSIPREEKRTALHCAAASGSETTCQALLRAGRGLGRSPDTRHAMVTREEQTSSAWTS